MIEQKYSKIISDKINTIFLITWIAISLVLKYNDAQAYKPPRRLSLQELTPNLCNGHKTMGYTSEQSCLYGVDRSKQNNGDYIQDIYIYSLHHGNSTLVVNLVNTKNVAIYNKTKPNQNISHKQVFVINKIGKTYLFSIKMIDTKQKASFNFDTQWMIGSIKARHDNYYQYHLPYAFHKSYVVSQGNNGNTHKDNHRYAYDFAMAKGQPIHAVRSGKVIGLESGYSESMKVVSDNLLTEANYIHIQHKDGTIATYAHMKQHGVMVRLGQYVNQGDMIGLAGNTGFSTGPHLHFHVSKNVITPNGIIMEQTIPIKFKVCGQTELTFLYTGKRYKNCGSY